MKLSKEACLELGKVYIQKNNKYPISKKWNISSCGCSRDRIYENWGSWLLFIEELRQQIDIPESRSSNKNTNIKSNNIVISEKANSYYAPKIDAVSIESVTQLILQKLDKSYNYVAKTKRGKSPKIILGEFIKIVITHGVGSPNCKEHFGIAEQTFNRIVKREFPTITLNGGGETWAFYLLALVNHKKCHKCAKIFYKDAFYSGVKHCKDCHAIKNKKYYNERIDIWHTYYDTHKSDYIARSAQRRAIAKQATPKWANLLKIKEIYLQCPPGYHVDHIIPLKSDIVCGLHVENNLQYLPAADNLQKSNNFKEDWYFADVVK
jgi:hypothetical protein